MSRRCIALAAVLFAVAAAPLSPAADSPHNVRKPKDEAELRYWLDNMVAHHRFSTAEVAAATGLSVEEIEAALRRFNVSSAALPKPEADAALKVLPYPGGRHPRIGFLDGAVRPQRETKISVFTPWNAHDYVVVDVPEAIWCQEGLLYLAHTHVPTLWTKKKVELAPLEWDRRDKGKLSIERKLPNGVAFAAEIAPRKDGVRMKLTLTNGSAEKLTDLRVQNCVMLKMASGFAAQTNDNKLFAKPYVACRAEDGKRWIITAWEPCDRAWANPPCPCLHSDPKFPDCAPGETKTLHGWLSFYRGDDVRAEFKRLDGLGWRRRTPMTASAGDFLQLADKTVLVFGLANRKSVAYHIGQVLQEAGAKVAFVVRNEKRREEVARLMPDAELFTCDVEHEDQIARLREEVSRRHPRLHGLVHSIAFADYSAGAKPFHETSKQAFLRAVDVSCYSLIAIANAFKDLLAEDGSVVTVSISTTRMASENYGFMAPVKAALDSSLAFLAKSFSRFSRVRFNAVAPGLLKTSASAGIPGYVDAYLYAEQATLRREAVRTEEVAHAAAFLLSPRSSGINAQQIVIDGGMSVNYFDRELIQRALRADAQ